MDAHHLLFPDESFDLVFMNGVLHHVNIQKVLSEVRRVLKPGGRVICQEPLRYGAFMKFLKRVWLQASHLQDYNHSEHEAPLVDSDLKPFGDLFSEGFVRKFNFLAKTNRLKNRFGPFARSLRWADYVLLSAMPPLRRFCTCAVCCYKR